MVTPSEKSDIGMILVAFGCLWVALSVMCYAVGYDEYYCMFGAIIGVGKFMIGIGIGAQ